MSIYSELMSEVNCRVNNNEVISLILERMIILESKKIRRLVGRGYPIDDPTSYSEKLIEYVNAKLSAHRFRRREDRFDYHLSWSTDSSYNEYLRLRNIVKFFGKEARKSLEDF